MRLKNVVKRSVAPTQEVSQKQNAFTEQQISEQEKQLNDILADSGL